MTPLAGSAGVGPEVAAIATSTRQDLEPGLRAWVASRPRPWALAGEVAAAHRVDDHGDLYRYDTWIVGAAVLGEWAVGTHATAVRFGAGPALVLRSIRLADGDEIDRDLVPEAGGRARMALDGPLWDAIGWQIRTGATFRASGVDWDVGAGVGVRW